MILPTTPEDTSPLPLLSRTRYAHIKQFMENERDRINHIMNPLGK